MWRYIIPVVSIGAFLVFFPAFSNSGTDLDEMVALLTKFTTEALDEITPMKTYFNKNTFLFASRDIQIPVKWTNRWVLDE